MLLGVSADGYTFCCIECCRHSGYEPIRMLLPDEYDGHCYGCGEELDGSERVEASAERA